MTSTIKLCVLALLGGAISALFARLVGINFILASLIVLATLLLLDFLVNMWRMALFTNAVIDDCDEVSEFVETCGTSLMIGSREELKNATGVAYQIPGMMFEEYGYFCILDGRREKEIMAAYNLSHKPGALYRIAEFIF